MANLVGSWKFESTENFEEFLRACGLPDEKVAHYAAAKPTEVISVAGDTWTLVYTTDKPHTMTFKLGEEFKETHSGGECMNTMTSDSSSRLIHSQKWEKITPVYTRELKGDKMHMTMEWNGVKAFRIYAKA